MKEKINEIKKELSIIFENIKDNTELNNLKVEYLGKNGKITELSKSMKDIANEEKKEIIEKRAGISYNGETVSLHNSTLSPVKN